MQLLCWNCRDSRITAPEGANEETTFTCRNCSAEFVRDRHIAESQMDISNRRARLLQVRAANRRRRTALIGRGTNVDISSRPSPAFSPSV
jgi:hypothetical protein